MSAEKGILWLKRIALSLSSFVIGFAAAIALVLSLREFPGRAVPPDMSKFERLGAMEDLVKKITGLAGLHTEIAVYLDTFNPWLCAYSSFRSRSIFLTNQCSDLMKGDGTYEWRNVGIVSNELGHILNAHSGTRVSDSVRNDDVEREQREAEEFAGWAMKRLGATLEQAQSYAVPVASPFAVAVPPEPKSLAAIERGWQRG